MVYFTSDLHLGDERVILLDGRPFASIEEMDSTLISNWRKTVKENDEVYIVGNLIAHNKTHDAYYYLSQLTGHLHLIVGNHDHTFLEDQETHKYFESIDYIKNIVLEGKEIVLCHYPLAEWNNYNRGSYHIYGHNDFKASKAYQYMSTLKRAMNCGCMLYGYKPATLEELAIIK